MINDKERELIKKSWSLVEPMADSVPDLFYKRLFELEPAYRDLFPENMDKQKRKLIKMLGFIVKAIDFSENSWKGTVSEDDDLFLVILAMGRRHSDIYKIPDDSYDTVGAALIWTLDYGLGQAFTDEVKAAWVHYYQLLSMTMKMGSAMVPK